MGISWADIGKTVAAAAPAVATALGGPVGTVAGACGALIATALGSEATPESVSASIASNPDALVRVRELEVVEREKLMEWNAVQLKADLDNLRSARDREVELARAGHGASWATTIVSLIITVGFFGMLGIVIIFGKDTLGEAGVLLLGSLASAFGAVTQYYLGSSLGSAEKDQYIRKGSAR